MLVIIATLISGEQYVMPNKCNQNYPSVDQNYFWELTNQILIKVPKVFKPTNKITWL